MFFRQKLREKGPVLGKIQGKKFFILCRHPVMVIHYLTVWLFCTEKYKPVYTDPGLVFRGQNSQTVLDLLTGRIFFFFSLIIFVLPFKTCNMHWNKMPIFDLQIREPLKECQIWLSCPKIVLHTEFHPVFLFIYFNLI